MATEINDGGPAFPLPTIDLQTHEIKYPKHVQGMSLRDWFAGQAMAGNCAADPNEDPKSGDLRSWSSAAYASMAEHCYALADAMLAAREQKGPK